MPAIIVLAFIAILALAVLAVLSITAHLLFSPWLLLVVIAVVAWVKFRPRGSRR